jgi:hypothetical protein
LSGEIDALDADIAAYRQILCAGLDAVVTPAARAKPRFSRSSRRRWRSARVTWPSWRRLEQVMIRERRLTYIQT